MMINKQSIFLSNDYIGQFQKSIIFIDMNYLVEYNSSKPQLQV